MTSFFDYQTNCQNEPERSLIWSFLTIRLDPFSPGMPVTAYEAAWLGYGGVGSPREEAFRASFVLTNVPVDPFEFVVSMVGPWFDEWAGSIAVGESDPLGDCPCDFF